MAATIEERVARLEAQVAMLAITPRRAGFGWTVEEVKERLTRPVVRGPREFEQLRRITGIFDGPEDLSERMRDYINGDREWTE